MALGPQEEKTSDPYSHSLSMTQRLCGGTTSCKPIVYVFCLISCYQQWEKQAAPNAVGSRNPKDRTWQTDASCKTSLERNDHQWIRHSIVCQFKLKRWPLKWPFGNGWLAEEHMLCKLETCNMVFDFASHITNTLRMML